MASARAESHLLESIRGMQSIKLAGTESLRDAGRRSLLTEVTNQEYRIGSLVLSFASIRALLFGLERVLVIWIGARLTLNLSLSVGMLLAYLAYRDLFAQRVAGLVDRLFEFRLLRTHADRLADIIDAPVSTRFRTDGTGITPSANSVEFVGVSFRYGNNDAWVLADCSFTVQPGESVAIVGPSGCGKSTVAKLALGLLPVEQGEVRIGGVRLDRIEGKAFCSMVAAVTQDDCLFAGTIAQNICGFEMELDQARIESSAALAGIHDEIQAMPMGYYTLMGDMGSALSGGQRQRLLLARALYRQPRLLILDEATSALDVHRERLVNAAIQQLKITRIIIAHRPETIASADRVLVLNGGRVVQSYVPERSPEAMTTQPMQPVSAPG